MALAQQVRPSEAAIAPPLQLRVTRREATRAVVRHFIASTCLGPGETALRDDEPLLANGILDSLGIVHLTAFIEETFDIAVPDEALLPENFGTVRRVAALVEHLEAQAIAAR